MIIIIYFFNFTTFKTNVFLFISFVSVVDIVVVVVLYCCLYTTHKRSMEYCPPHAHTFHIELLNKYVAVILAINLNILSNGQWFNNVRLKNIWNIIRSGKLNRQLFFVVLYLQKLVAAKTSLFIFTNINSQITGHC